MADAITMGSSGMQLILRVGVAFVAIMAIVVLWFISKYGRRAWNTRKTYKIHAVIYNPDGTFMVDKIGKFRGGDGVDKMLFLNLKESMPVIDPKYIIAKQVTLWRYAPGQYAVIPPKVWLQDPKKFKIEVINYQMKNFAFLEQRAAVSRWTFIKNALQQWAPYITVLMILILCGVAIWLVTKMAYSQFNAATAARIAECAHLIGGGSSVAPPA